MTAITIDRQLIAFVRVQKLQRFFSLLFFQQSPKKNKKLVAFWIFFSYFFQIPKIKTRLGDCEAT